MDVDTVFCIGTLGINGDFLLIYDITLVISVVVSLVLTIQISKMNGDAYLPGIIWFAWGMVYSYKDIRNESFQESEVIFFISLFFSYLLIGIILMCIIKTRVFPYYSWFQPVKDENGNFIFQELSERKVY